MCRFFVAAKVLVALVSLLGVARAADGVAAKSAQDRSFWSFQPIRKPSLPRVKDASWSASPIDLFILAELEEQGLTPVRPARKHRLMRRASFDLLGLPPRPEEVSAFLDDDSPAAYANLVDRLLSSPHYGERWARFWLDVARYGEDQAHLYSARLYTSGFRYRDWVVDAFNRDMPYDRFVKEQIAGDLLPGPGGDRRRMALGYFALGPVYFGVTDPKKAAAQQLDDRVDTLTRGFLGLTVSCARCHDHKYDPISMQDYYALAGVFANTEYEEHPLVPQTVVEEYKAAQAKVAAEEKAIKESLAKASAELSAGTKGEASPIPKDQLEERLPPATKEALAARRVRLEELKKAVPPKYPVAHSVRDKTEIENIRIYIRGDPHEEGEAAPRRFLSIASTSAAPRRFGEGSGRLELAEAIVEKDNPLTARVIVNRIWRHHFGRGVVDSPSNFGKLGDRPTHPELLDYLASRLIESGWSLKTIHREILLSSTYALSSDFDEDNFEIDADNRFLWRMNRRRLDVEAWRDALLSVSGDLDGALGGPSESLDSGSLDAGDNRRRTLYAHVSRHDLDGLLRIFDFPDPNITCAKRTVTTVPQQQLYVLNSEFMISRAIRFAARLTSNADDDTARIHRAFLLAFHRQPNAREIQLGLAFLDAPRAAETPESRLSKWEQYAQVLLGSNEFLYVD